MNVNCYFVEDYNPHVKKVDEKSPTPIAEIITIEGDVPIIQHANEVVFIDNRLNWRSVTPDERMKNGMVTAVDGSQFLRPSLEDVQRVSAVLASIDEKFSYDAALEKFAASATSSAESDNVESSKFESNNEHNEN